MSSSDQPPRYLYRVFWSSEDEQFVATCFELPELSGLGASPEEALGELSVAVELAAEAMSAVGTSLPPPIDFPVGFSGQLRLRIPKSLHRDLAILAEAEGVSLNTLLVSYLSAGRDRSGAKDGYSKGRELSQLRYGPDKVAASPTTSPEYTSTDAMTTLHASFVASSQSQGDEWQH